jgi:hypothetical protein
MSHTSREDYIYFARLAEQGERYEDMIRYMKEVSRVSNSRNLKGKPKKRSKM